MRVELPYGARPYGFEVSAPEREVEILALPRRPPPAPVAGLLRGALDAPIGGSLTTSPGARVTLIVSDATRNEPRAAFVDAVRERLGHVHWTLAIATGTHGPTRVDELGLPREFLAEAALVNHDGHRPDDLVDVGVTSRGTPVRVHRCVVDADLVLATGCIRPHYFAGFGAGAKAVFPGLGEARAIRMNHRLKGAPGARAGRIVDNPCREDLEEAARLAAPRAFVVNAVCGPDEQVHAAVAGDLVEAFRAGARLATPWFAVRAKPAPVVVASDVLPVTASLYQAAKIAAASAPFVEPGGTLVVVAECRDGIGPLETVNEAIFRTGVLPRLPTGANLVLVSALPRTETDKTLLAYAPSVESVLARTTGRVLILPRAAYLIAEDYS